MASLRLASRFLRGPATATIPATGRLFSSSAGHHETPQIELEFVSAASGSDGQYSVEKATAASGAKRLRNIMLDNNIDLYASFRKVVNCGGRGLCGTCMVELSMPEILSIPSTKLTLGLCSKTQTTSVVSWIQMHIILVRSSISHAIHLSIVEGMDLLSEKTKSEFRNLKKKPDSWRLACQTTVGNKENSGKVVVQKMPQTKK